MSCQRYASEITDHACGAEIAPDAAEHLRVCASCRALFDEQRRVLGDMDRELQLALAVEPSERFASGVRARVERAPAVGGAALWWRALAAAAVVIVAIAIGSMTRGGRPAVVREEPLPLGAASAPPVAESAPPLVASGAPRDDSSRTDSPRRVERTSRRQPTPAAAAAELQVVVDPKQTSAIARYLSLVRSGTLDTSHLAKPLESGAEPPPDLVVAPLRVQAISVADVEIATGPLADRRGPQ
jgi:hypothetical protein